MSAHIIPQPPLSVKGDISTLQYAAGESRETRPFGNAARTIDGKPNLEASNPSVDFRRPFQISLATAPIHTYLEADSRLKCQRLRARLKLMSTARQRELISADDYLAGELISKVKHEYLGGFVYAMAGARNAHNVLATNVLGSLHARLRGSKCRPYNSDTKIRVQLPTQVRFYYPDASVVCHSNSPDCSFQDQPVVIVEVLSRDTRRTDEGEKKDAYLTIPSLTAYLLVEQEMPAVTVYRRTEQGFKREVYKGTDVVIPLPDLAIDLPLAEIYEDVEFTPESE